MKQAMALFALLAVTLVAGHARFGYATVYQIGYGAFSLMAAMISLTFLWLWARRATPLALGMSFSWAGAASVMGWWWVFNLFSRPGFMVESEILFLFLALYFAGAVLHFAVIAKSVSAPPLFLGVPVFASLALSALVRLLI